MTTTFDHETQEQLERKLIACLEAWGYKVLKAPIPFEQPLAVAVRLGFYGTNSLSRRLSQYQGAYMAERGASGRLLRLRVDPDLELFLTQKPHRQKS